MAPTPDAIRGCAEWLVACLGLGWRKSDLDFLQMLWWKYHDDKGELMPPGQSRPDSEQP